jgi:hypothetical protein
LGSTIVEGIFGVIKEVIGTERFGEDEKDGTGKEKLTGGAKDEREADRFGGVKAGTGKLGKLEESLLSSCDFSTEFKFEPARKDRTDGIGVDGTIASVI